MINCNRRDGSARAVNEVAEKLADRGHEVHLYARKAEDLDLNKIRWHQVPGPGWPEVADFLSYFLKVNRAIPRRYFDIVHGIGCNTLRANVITIQNIQPAKKKILDRLGTLEKVSAPRRATRALYLKVTSEAEHKLYTHRPGRRPPLFLPVSRGVESELREHYDIGPAPVRIVPNAADLSIFKPISEEQRLAWRKENGLGPEDIVLIFAGGEWVRKGLDLAIKGLSKVPDRRAKLVHRRRRRGARHSQGLGRRMRNRRSRDLWRLSARCANRLGQLGHFLFPKLVRGVQFGNDRGRRVRTAHCRNVDQRNRGFYSARNYRRIRQE